MATPDGEGVEVCMGGKYGPSVRKILERLPAVQQLLYRLIGCQHQGGAYHKYLIQCVLALVL
ncbi:hypothetical protein MKX01_000340, partial [Papaver californicum]